MKDLLSRKSRLNEEDSSTDDDEVIDDQNYEAPDTSSGKRGKQGEDDIDPNRYMGL